MGDRLYDKAALPSDPPQALHSFRLDLKHPAAGLDLKILAPPPRYWNQTWLSGLQVEERLEKMFSL